MIPRQVIFYATSLWDIRLFVPENRAQEAHELLEEYRKATAETPRDESVDSRVFRAFRASVLGVPLLPVGLHLFSAWLLRGIRYRDLDARSRRRYSAAQVINWSVFVLLAAIVIRWLR